MCFPAQSLLRLLSLGKDVVGANYPRREIPPIPTAMVGGKHVGTPHAKALAGDVDEVDRLGLGLCLVRAAVLRAIGFPLFGIEPEADGISFTGEDTVFFRKVRAGGFKVFLDHRLSGSVGHLHEVVLTNEDAIAGAETLIQGAMRRGQ